jgi:hypothetical protein
VNSQNFCETFVCLWSDCKVFNKPSCSRSWLERHVLSHGGNKPLQCIVQKCRQRFSSQVIIFITYKMITILSSFIYIFHNGNYGLININYILRSYIKMSVYLFIRKNLNHK